MQRQRLPEDLDAMAPGPGLGALLESVDVQRVNGHDAVRVLAAQARQAAHAQAGMLAAIATIARCAPGGPDADPTRLETPDLDSTVDEVAFAVTLTRAAAADLVGLAEDTVTHPGLGQALAAGVLDLPRLRVISAALAGLDPGVAAAVVARILPQAGELTTGQLRARLARLVLCVDPDAATRRRQRAEAQRRVAHYADPDGTAALAATGLPVARAATAWGRLDALATATKRAGDPRTVDQLRADLLLDLLDGTFTQPSGAGGQGSVGVHVVADLDTLRGLSHEPGHVSGWGPVAADVLRRLAGDPSGDRRFQFSVLDAEGHLIGTVITARHRFPTTRQARHIRARDHTCTAPGCRVPARRCDLDHTVPHAQGGPTLTSNLGATCRWHHAGKHRRGLRVRQIRPGHFLWTTTHGHTYHRHEQHPP